MARCMLGLAGALACASPASAALILSDSFDLYADQAAFNAVWSQTAATLYTLDTTFGNRGQSVRIPSPVSGTTGRYFRNLGGSFDGTDAEPLVFSFDFYLDPAGTAANWSGSRQFAEIRSYSGGTFNSGALQQLLAIGVFNTSDDSFSGSRFQGRIAFASTNWNTLDQDDANPANDVTRSSGWHQMRIEVSSTLVKFYVDGVFGEQESRGSGVALGAFDSIVLGSGLSDGTAPQDPFWIDNVRVETIPEPAALALLGVSALTGLRRRGR